MQIEDVNIEDKSYKQTNYLPHASLARGPSTLEKWHSTKGVVTTHLPNSEKWPTLSPKLSCGPR